MVKASKRFVESNSLGTNRPVTIGYFTKLAPEFTHLGNFNDYLVNQLVLIDMEAETAIKLAPHLKSA